MIDVKVTDLPLPGVKDAILRTSFEYMLARVAQEHADFYGKQYLKIDYFNQHNKLTRSSTFVYPFFIALANGHSEFLYNLFGDFQAMGFGPASARVIEMAYAQENLRLKYFQLKSDLNFAGIEIIHAANNFEKLITDICDEPISLPDGRTGKFADIRIESNLDWFVDKNEEKKYGRVLTPLTEAISKSVEIIHEQSDKNFFAANSKTIMFQASYFSAFENAYRENLRSIIKYEQIEPPVRRPFYLKTKEKSYKEFSS